MGKIRVKTIGIDDEEKKEKQEAKKRAELKRAEAAKFKEENPAEEKSESKPAEEAPKEEAKKKKTSSYAEKHNTRTSGKKFNAAKALIEKNKTYTLDEALILLPKIGVAKFDETVELHINTHEKGISGNISLPHGTGKKTRVAIASDKILADVEKGIIDFDVLIAEPTMMPKLAKVAKILGPKGLMPNPKAGTVTPKPEEAAKKFEAGQINFKTESKNPILHVVVGKVSFGDKKLSENIKAFIKEVKKQNIKNITLKSTMSPGIKIKLL